MKTIYLIHGWSGNPNNAWFPWVKEKLEEKGFLVYSLEMPDRDHPKIEPWVSKIKETVISPDENTHFIGHSIGCQTIMRYLETSEKPVGKIVLVAPFFSLIGTEEDTDEEKELAKPWLETEINTDKVKINCKEIVCIFSDNDPVVSLDQKEIFEKRLNAKTIIEHNMGHFSDDDGVLKLQSVVDQY